MNCLYVCALTPPICRLAPCLYISFVDPRTHCGSPRTIGNELENKKERERELDRPPAGRSKRFSNFFSLSIRYWNSGAHLSWQYFHLLSVDWIKLTSWITPLLGNESWRRFIVRFILLDSNLSLSHLLNIWCTDNVTSQTSQLFCLRSQCLQNKTI